MATKKTSKKAAKKGPKTAATAKRSARATPKVSPQRGMDVGDWVRKRAVGWQAGVVARLLAIADKAAPKATVSIKWGQPVVTSGGPVAFIKVAKAHVTFGFWRGAELSDPKRVLEGAGDRMRHMKITSAEALDEKLATGLLRQAVALNEKLGDPTKRG